ncbi:NAD(P)-dependent dehydrogenase (short-subunit alcohol dehydrogenase family) [Bradyrhizobium sp. LM2.7]
MGSMVRDARKCALLTMRDRERDFRMNKIDLNGRVAIVTGGAQGFGRAIVQRFVDSGAKVAIWDFDAPLAEKTAKEIGGETKVFKVDITDTAGVEQARDATLAAFGKIDILVNNAGIAGVNKPVWETDLEEWRKVLRINLDRPLHLLQGDRARDAQAEIRADRQHRVHCRQGRQSERLALFGLQGRPDRADEIARQGARRA